MEGEPEDVQASDAEALMARRLRPDRLAIRAALGEVEQALFGRASSPLTLQRFTLVKKIGMGARGVVYAAYDPQLDRKVAIKILRDRAGDERESLIREAQAIARLAHPNVVTVHDVRAYGRDEFREPGADAAEGVFIVMEHVEGADLRAWSEARTRSWSEIVDIFIAAGQGLAAAHRAGIVHRDFKPENVLVGVDGRARVVDFGLARPERSGARPTLVVAGEGEPLPSQVATMDAVVAGTPLYMSPEQHRGEALDDRSDQFSFCASLLELLGGQAPFVGKSLRALLDSKMRPDLRALRVAGTPAWLQRIVAKGLSPERNDRYDDMETLLRALARGRQRPRQRLAALAAIGLLGLGAAAAFVYAGERGVDCDDHARQLDGVWGGERAETLAKSFARTQRPYAADTAVQVVDVLDSYARNWLGARVAVCEATLLGGEDPASLERRVRCLDRRLEAADELARLMVEHPDEVVEHAVDAAANLPVIEDCEREGVALREGRAPDAEQEAALARTHRELARAQAHFDAADYTGGLAIATGLVEALEGVHGPTLARALMLRGRFEAQLALGERADQSLFDARVQAEASGANELATRALIESAGVEARLLGDYREAERALALARAQVEQLDLGVQTRARLELETVFLRRMQGRYADAGVAAKALLDLWRRPGERAHSRLGDAYMALAEVQYKERDFVGAAQSIEQAQAAWATTHGRAHPSSSAGEQRLGDMAWRTGRYDEALEHHERAYEIERAARGPEHPQSLARLMGLANVQAAVGRHAEAGAALRSVLERYESFYGLEHPTTANARLNLASQMVEAGRFVEAEPQLLAVLEYYEREHDSLHPSVPYVLLDLGRCQAAAGREGEALVYFEDARAHWERALGAEHPKLAWALEAIGQSHLRVGDKVSARKAFEDAIALHDVTTNDPLHLGDLHFGLARALDSGPDAIEHARRARGLFARSIYRAAQLEEVERWLGAQGVEPSSEDTP